MLVTYLLYPGFTALDVVGTFQVLSAAPGMESLFVAAQAGRVLDGTGLCPLEATASLSEVAAADVVVVPGSDWVCAPSGSFVEWLRGIHLTTSWTTSVGTGSLYLAAAGVLDGIEASTHWSAANALTDLGVQYTGQRVAHTGKILTSAGGSACIDLALTLLGISHGPAVAQAVQLALEYDPQPPFDAGSPAKAPTQIGELVTSYYAQRSS